MNGFQRGIFSSKKGRKSAWKGNARERRFNGSATQF